MTLTPNGKQPPYVDDAKCQVCRKCVARKVCRVKAIVAIDPGEPPFIDGHRCMACYDCVSECPAGAIIRPVMVVQHG